MVYKVVIILLGLLVMLRGVSFVFHTQENIVALKGLFAGLLSDSVCSIILRFFLGPFFIFGGLISIIKGVQEIL